MGNTTWFDNLCYKLNIHQPQDRTNLAKSIIGIVVAIIVVTVFIIL